MFKRMNKTANIIVSVIMIIAAVIMSTLLDDYFERIDMEIANFFAGFLFGIGFFNLAGMLFKPKKETIK